VRYIRNISDDQNKYGDTDEVFRFNLLQGDDIFNFGDYPISVNIANSSGYILSMTPEKEFGNSVVKLDFNNDLLKSLPPDSYLLEVEVTLTNGTVSKFPTKGGMPFTINKNLKGVQGTLVPTVTFDAVLESVDEKIAVYMDTVKKGNKGDTGSSALPVAGVYPTLADLTTANPDHAYVYITTDNGNWNYWGGTTWVAGGVYQSMQLAQNSVLPEHLSTTIVPKNKSFGNYDSDSKTTSLYIINEPITKSGIINVRFKGAGIPGDIYLYFLKKEGLSFSVMDRVLYNSKSGWNTVNTNFNSVGDGSEYIGVLGSIKYTRTGGTGFYETANANRDNIKFLTVDNTIGVNQTTGFFDFSLYYTVENKKIVELINDVEYNIDTKSPIIDLSEEKDWSNYTYVTQNKNFFNNKYLKSGNIVVHIKVDTKQRGKLYIAEKNDFDFTIKQMKEVDFIAGENVVDMEYTTYGTGYEYIGFYGQANYSRTASDGGTGFYESKPTDLKSYAIGEVISTDAHVTDALGTWDMSCWPEYVNYGIKKSIASLENDVFSLNTNVDEIKNKQEQQDSSIKLTDFNMPKYLEIQDKIGFVGRWFDTTIGGLTVKATINEGSELYFKVKNTTTINVNFVLNSVKATPFFAYSIDGSPMTRQLITTPLLKTVTTDEHVIRIVIDGLTESEDKWVGEKGVAFKDVTVDVGGVVTGIFPKNRQILFHGDSITEGVRVLNMNADSTGNSATGAFPYVASTNLNAISYRVGFGASGITKGGSGGVPELIQVIDKMTNTREAPYIQPDIVVMNMGTNDRAETSAVFTTKLNSVLDRLSIKYSGTPIFVMVPFIQAFKTEIENAVSTRSNMYIVETADWNITTTDGLHPDIAGGIVAGKKLADAIVSVLGKDFFI
jgi:lysophospholipase L1-like esterase